MANLSPVNTAFSFYDRFVATLKKLDGIPLLLLRLFLAPIFIIAGYSKLQMSSEGVGFFAGLAPDPSIVQWFGNADWGLGLPAPTLMAFLVAWAEFFGGWLLLLGAATRLVSIPLLFTMFVAAATAHWDNGWFAIAPSNPDTSVAKVLSWVGIPGAEASLENSDEVSTRLSRMRSILSENGNTNWLYEKGSIVVLNNGIEFAATYFLMCLILLWGGGGAYTSVDYWLRRYLGRIRGT